MYIGTQPAIGQNRKLDSIAASFNGVLTTFNLTVNTSSIVPSNVYQLFISLGGVLQNPGVDFTISGNQLTFTTAPTASLSFFGIFQGDSITGTPTIADATITTAKLATGLTVTHTAGTAAVPSITFSGNLANGIFAPAANTFGITTSGTERMRISANGQVTVTTNTLYTGNGSTVPFQVERTATDGDLVQFYQAAALEGGISVSGTTVSYNGAHLSRWSQLPSGAERTEILRGSVLSNIDEMCQWGDEENEQLNRMKVSDVEGDKNVSGVFQAWDDDDDTYTDDFYCAMTGDFIIRIAEGMTVERGDLLMSAGDGTAKPQDDDIIRSKTIAKVTSTNVSCTYDDGSYCVPCVLMAC